MDETTDRESTWRGVMNTRLWKNITALLPLHDKNDADDSDTKAFSTAEESPEDRQFPLPQHLEPDTFTIVSLDEPACRICQETSNGMGKNRLVTPCKCRGSAEYVHKRCLHKWCETKKTTDCEICNSPYQRSYLKPPPLPASDENSLVSSSMVLVLFFSVFGASVYLFLSHMAAVDYTFHGDSWLLLSLLVGSLLAFLAFLLWFVKNTRRILRNRRDSLQGSRRSEPVSLSVIATGT